VALLPYYIKVGQGIILVIGDQLAYSMWHTKFLLRLSKSDQPILAKVISPDQMAFIPTRYILDNILLLHETIAWTKESNQEAIFLKLDF